MIKSVGRYAAIAGVLAASMLASGVAVADGDAAAGEAGFKTQCSMCHATTAGTMKMGPSMFGMYGSQAGSVEGAKYKGLVGADFVWDDANLDAFLADPKGFLNGETSMPMPVKDAQKRADLIAYLKTLK